MQGILRSCGPLAKGLACWAPPRFSFQVAAFSAVLLQPLHTPPRDSAVNTAMQGRQVERAIQFNPKHVYSKIQSSHSGPPKDYSLPNASWNPVMMEQFHKFSELTKDKTWKKLPSYRLFIEQIPGMTREQIEEAKKKDTRLYIRNLDIEGAGFEFVAILNPLEKKIVSVFQLGPYLEGNPGFVHGGAIVTAIESLLVACAIFTTGFGTMANLNTNFKSPITLGSVVLIDCTVDREEGRKLFLSGRMKSVDGQILHTEATSLFIKGDPKKTSIKSPS